MHWSSRYGALVCSVCLAITAAAAHISAQSGPSCEAVEKDPAKYAGVRVVYFGSTTGFEIKSLNGKMTILHPWACKDKDGRVLGGSFGELSTESKWSEAAKKADGFKSLFQVVGTVKGTVEIQGKTLPLLTDVSVDLAPVSK